MTTKQSSGLLSLPESLFDRIMPEPMSGCWLWMGVVNGRWGYGRVRVGVALRAAHLVIHEILRGAVPGGLVLDHLCRVRSCVNPWHLEIVTTRENVLRGVGRTAENSRRTHCMYGHPLSGGNLYLKLRDGQPRRDCRTCAKQRARANGAKRRAAFWRARGLEAPPAWSDKFGRKATRAALSQAREKGAL